MQERRSHSEGVKAEYKTVVFQSSFCLDCCTLTQQCFRSLLYVHSLRDIRVKHVAADESLGHFDRWWNGKRNDHKKA